VEPTDNVAGGIEASCSSSPNLANVNRRFGSQSELVDGGALSSPLHLRIRVAVTARSTISCGSIRDRRRRYQPGFVMRGFRSVLRWSPRVAAPAEAYRCAFWPRGTYRMAYPNLASGEGCRPAVYRLSGNTNGRIVSCNAAAFTHLPGVDQVLTSRHLGVTCKVISITRQ
jgi:hypothetical protein